MRISRLILGGSAVLNALLLTVVVVGLSRDARSLRPPVAIARAVGTVEIASNPEVWESLNDGDLMTLRNRLRAERFPPEIVRAILTAQIRAAFAARRQALARTEGDIPFWRNPAMDSPNAIALRGLEKEERAALEALLGPDPDSAAAVNLRQQLPNLSTHKILQLAAVRDRYDEQRKAIHSSSRGGLTPSERQTINSLDATMRAELAAILTPREIEDYDLRFSGVMQTLGDRLTAFDPTEQEFRTLVLLQQAFDQNSFSPGGRLSPEGLRARREAISQLNDDVKAALGPERFAEYQRSLDGNYQRAAKLVARLELPPETAPRLFALQKDFERREQSIDRDNRLTPEQRRAELTILATEARERVSSTLGARGYEAYKQNGGAWLENLLLNATPAGPANSP